MIEFYVLPWRIVMKARVLLFVLGLAAAAHAVAPPPPATTKLILYRPSLPSGAYGAVPMALRSAIGFQLEASYEAYLIGRIPSSSLAGLANEAESVGIAFSVKEEYDWLYLPSGVLDLRQPLPATPPQLSFLGLPSVYVIQFAGPVKAEWEAALSDPSLFGGTMLASAESNARIMSFPADVNTAQLPNRLKDVIAEIQAVVPYQPAWRIEKSVTNSPGNSVEVSLFSGASASQLIAAMASLDIDAAASAGQRAGYATAQVRLASGSLAQLAASPIVRHLRGFAQGQPADERASSIVAGELQSNTCLDYYGFLAKACNGCLDSLRPSFASYRLSNNQIPATGLFDTVTMTSYESDDLDGSEPLDAVLIGSGFVYSDYTNKTGNPTTSGATETGLDCLGHGTMVAAAISGRPMQSSSCKLNLGIAPRAKIYGIKSIANCWNVGAHSTFNDWAGATLSPKKLAGCLAGECRADLDERISRYVQAFDLDPLTAGYSLRVVNNSWQIKELQGDFSSDTYSVDVRSRQASDSCISTNCRNRETMFVFAAGNASPGQGQFRDYCNGHCQVSTLLDWDSMVERAVFAPGTSKNAFTVGSSAGLRDYFDLPSGSPSRYDNDWTWAANGLLPGSDHASAVDRARFSGAGIPGHPTRIKPDLLAPTTRFVSAVSKEDDFGGALAGVFRNDYLDATGFDPISPGTIHDLPDNTVSRELTTASGTSFAAPQVSGAAILLTKFFDYRRSPPSGPVIDSIFADSQRIWPSPDLIKAALIAHARSLVGGRNPLFAASGTPNPTLTTSAGGGADLTAACCKANSTANDRFCDIGLDSASLTNENRLGQRPDPFQGWGGLNFAEIPDGTTQGNPAARSGTPPATGGLFDETPRLLANNTLLTAGSRRTFRMTVSDARKPVAIVVAWTDHPGIDDASGALVNDLDLMVTIGPPSSASRSRVSAAAGVTAYRGNCFEPASGLSRAWCGSVDTDNNVEAVFLPAGQAVGSVIEVTIDGLKVAKDCWDPTRYATQTTPPQQDFGLYAYNVAGASVTPGSIVPTVERCGRVTFRTTSPAPTGISWNFGDSGASSQLTPTHLYASGGTFDVTAAVTTASGLENQTYRIEIPVGVSDALPPLRVYTVTGGNQVSYANWTTTGPLVNVVADSQAVPCFTSSTGVAVALTGSASTVAGSSIAVAADGRSLTFQMPPAASIPGMTSAGGRLDVILSNLGTCGTSRLERVFLRSPVPASAAAVILSRPFTSTFGNEKLDIVSPCGFLNPTVTVGSNSATVQTNPDTNRITITVPAGSASASASTVSVTGVKRTNASGNCPFTGPTYATATAQVEYVDYGYIALPQDHRFALLRTGANPPAGSCTGLFNERRAIDCGSFPTLPAAAVADVDVAGPAAAGGSPAAAAYADRRGVIRLVDLSASTGAPQDSFVDQYPIVESELPCPSSASHWSPRAVKLDPYGKLVYVLHRQAATDSEENCGGNPTIVPVTIIDRTTAKATEIDTEFSEPGSTIDAGHPVDAVPYVKVLASAPTDGTTYSKEGSTIVRRFLFVSQSGPALVPPFLCLNPPSDSLYFFTYPLVLAAYDLNTFRAPGGVEQSIPAAERNPRVSYMTLDAIAGCETDPNLPFPLNLAEMGLDLATSVPSDPTSPAHIYVVAPLAGNVVKLRISDLLAGSLPPNPACTAPFCQVAVLPAGAAPSDAVVVRTGSPTSDFVIACGAGNDSLHRIDTTAMSILNQVLLTGGNPVVALHLPTAVAARKRSDSAIPFDAVFTANSGTGIVSKSQASNASNLTSIPAGLSVTRIAIQPLPSATGFAPIPKEDLLSAPESAYGAGQGSGGNSGAVLKAKLVGDAIDLEAAVVALEAVVHVRNLSDQLVRDAEQFIVDTELRNRTIVNAQAIATFYAEEQEGP